MEIKLAVLADYATTNEHGKLVLGGIFDAITLARVPGVHQTMSVALRMSAAEDEGAEHRITLRLVDPDGDDVVPPIEGELRFRGTDDQLGSGAQLVVHLNQVEFKTAGAHRFDILVDGMMLGSIDLVVRVAASRETRH